MDDDKFDDLKQFITVTVSQSEERVISQLRQEMADGFSGIADAIEGINQRDDKQDKSITKLNKRVSRLEKANA